MLAAFTRSFRLIRNSRRRLLSEVADDGEGIVKKSATNALLPMGADVPRPAEVLSIPLSRRPLFPGLAYPVRLQDKSVIDEVQRLMKSGSPYIAMFYRRKDVAHTGSLNVIQSVNEIYNVGTLGQVFRIVPSVSIDGQLNEAQAFVMGHRRLITSALNQVEPFSICQVEHFEEKKLEARCSLDPTTIKAYKMEIVATMREIRALNPMFKEQLELFLQTVEFNDPEKSGILADIAAQLTSADGTELQEILEAFDPGERLAKALLLLKKELELSKMQSDISKQVEEKINKNQRRFLLMEQLKSIKKELGLERDEKEELVTRFRDRLKDRHPPDEIISVIDEESNKLQHLEPAASEFNVTRNYLDWLTIMPWGIYTSEAFDVAKAKAILDAEHYGMDLVKSRILEFIAVGQLLGESPAGKILCLVGPPGVGKTSIGKSVAHSLGRKFFRFSVGGLTDVAEIKGHRRTYVGAMPGKLIQCLKQTQTSNPVVLIDEIDKIGRGVQGDPSSALLEVLDPEQNGTFVDHYLDAPVDLSRILFICTANSEDPIPKPLADRIEFIRLPGYIHDEKMAIAKRYLSSIARSKTGISTEQVDLTDNALDALIRGYCREAGVRELAKRIDQIYRKAAFKIVEGATPPLVITDANLHEYVGGHAIFKSELMYDKLPPGVCMGLAWTSMGGSLLYIEGAIVDTQKDKGALQYTGNLGQVMKESAELSYSVAKQFLADIELGNHFFRDAIIHLHAPEGAVSKEGPSAGITMVSGLVSLALNRPIRSDVAMTGEISLTGKVLRIGGVKEKAIAAKRAGIRTILVPEHNRSDVEELPDNVKEGIQFKFCSTFDDVYREAFTAA